MQASADTCLDCAAGKYSSASAVNDVADATSVLGPVHVDGFREHE